MAETMNYDRSPIPPEKPGGIASERNPDRAITVDDRGQMNYASAAAEGMVEIDVPVPHGPRAQQRMHARDFPATVVRYVEESLRPNPYPVASPMKSATETFHHFVGAAKGLSLLDEGGLKRMEQLAKEFEAEPDREEFFAQVIRPYMLSMTPRRR
jgi:hypothetical protein